MGSPVATAPGTQKPTPRLTEISTSGQWQARIKTRLTHIVGASNLLAGHGCP
jgi:hypothetical protein